MYLLTIDVSHNNYNKFGKTTAYRLSG